MAAAPSTETERETAWPRSAAELTVLFLKMTFSNLPSSDRPGKERVLLASWIAMPT